MKRVYVNEKWCLGCRLCEYNCAFAETGAKRMEDALKGVKISPRVNIDGGGGGGGGGGSEGGNNGGIYFAVNCRHCDDSPCVKGCLTGALQKDASGIVTIDAGRCVGCFTCVALCPYGSVAPDGDGHAAKKCELCANTTDGVPRCVKGCPNGAIVFEER